MPSIPIEMAGLLAMKNVLVYNNDLQAMAALEAAMETLQKRGSPDRSSYSLTKIIAIDEEDLNLKLHLIMIEPFNELLAGKITGDEFISIVTPISNAVTRKLMESIQFPNPQNFLLDYYYHLLDNLGIIYLWYYYQYVHQNRKFLYLYQVQLYHHHDTFQISLFP